MGLGGIGKTQLAIEYAYRHAAEFDLVWWLRAETPATLVGDYAALAGKLGLPGAGEMDLAAVARAVQAALERRARWLLVFDNAEGEEGLRELLPRGGGGRVLITSRNPNWDRATCLDVPLFRRASSVAFLLKRTGQGNEAAAGALAEELVDLPLALEQAAAFVRRSGMTLAEYLDVYQKQRDELWRRERPPRGYPATVRTTWTLAVDRLKEQQPAAVDLLNLGAFLAPEAIPQWLFRDYYTALPSPLNTVVADTFMLNDCIEALQSGSLVAVADGNFSFHPLVQAATRDALTADERRRWTAAAVSLLNAAFPYRENDPVTWAPSGALVGHALAAANHAETLGVEPEGTGRLLRSTGSFFEGRAEYHRARACYERALRVEEAALGPNHLHIAATVGALGGILQAQGDLAGARAAFERALRIDERVYGPDHPSVARDVRGLGWVLKDEGDLVGARAAFERALAILERALGPEHPHVATAVNNLGSVRQAQGELAGARAAHERALRIDEKVLGPGHADVARDLHSLGWVLKDEGDLAGARACFERALRIDENALGPEHPRTRTARSLLESLS